MNRFSKFFINALAASQEPRLWQDLDAQGQLRWQVYDPTRQEHRQFDSEEAARAWFEQRLHQPPTPSIANRLYTKAAFDGVR